jgi:hypothetical protein
MSLKRVPKRFVRLLEAFRFFCLGGAQKIDHGREDTSFHPILFVHNLWTFWEDGRENSFNYFFISLNALLPGNDEASPVEVIIGLIFDIYYKETKAVKRQRNVSITW